MTKVTDAQKAGFLYKEIFSITVFGVRLLTNPTNSSWGRFFVKALITMATTVLINHAQSARQKLAAIIPSPPLGETAPADIQPS